MKKAILIDIDGTICDSKYPISYLNGERDTNNYETYYRTLGLVEPIPAIINDIVTKALTLSMRGEQITLVFLTGRTAQINAVFDTMQFINTNFSTLLSRSNVHFDFYFRPINYHSPSIQYKIEKFEMLKSLYNFIHIYEDELSNVKMFNANKQDECIVHWVKGSYDYSLEEQISEEPSADIVIHTI